MKYVVIIPAKNEEGSIEEVILSCTNQIIRPQCILIMDNDSNDRTAEIVKALKKKDSIIQYFNYKSNSKYSLGGKIVKIFDNGKKYIDQQGIVYDYLAKIDADISFNNKVFLDISKVIKNKNLGIVSPTAYIKQNNKIIYSSTPSWHTTGDMKIYNKQCYEDIGGLIEDLGWDCADNIAAMEKGYNTEVLSEVFYRQNRPIGRYSILKGWKRQGIGAYKLRYNYPYIFLKIFHDLFRPPYIIGTIPAQIFY